MAGITLKIHPGDNICVALEDLQKGFTINVNGEAVKLLHDVPAKHKFSLHDLNIGDRIIMYGVLVGTAVSQIKRGEILSTKNTCHASGKYGYNNKKPAWIPPRRRPTPRKKGWPASPAHPVCDPPARRRGA